MFVRTRQGLLDERGSHAIEKVLHHYPTAELRTQDEFKGSVAYQIDQILNLVYVLLAMASGDRTVRHREHAGAVGVRAHP